MLVEFADASPWFQGVVIGVGLLLFWAILEIAYLAGNRHKRLVTKSVDGTNGPPYRTEALVTEARDVSWKELMADTPKYVQSWLQLAAWVILPGFLLSVLVGFSTGECVGQWLDDFLNCDCVSPEREENHCEVEPPEVDPSPSPIFVRHPNTDTDLGRVSALSKGGGHLRSDVVEILFRYYLTSGQIPVKVRPVELSDWFVGSIWQDINYVSVGIGPTERFMFFRQSVLESYDTEDLRVLSSYLNDIVDPGDSLCYPEIGRYWLRVAIVMALRDQWPMDRETVQRVVRVSEADPESVLFGCGDLFRNKLRHHVEVTLTLWRRGHPSEMQALLGVSTLAAEPCCPPSLESPSGNHDRQTQILIELFRSRSDVVNSP